MAATYFVRLTGGKLQGKLCRGCRVLLSSGNADWRRRPLPDFCRACEGKQREAAAST